MALSGRERSGNVELKGQREERGEMEECGGQGKCTGSQGDSEEEELARHWGEQYPTNGK